MAKAKLIINGEQEITADDGAISIGRASDNVVSLSNDSNISRYHAEIEKRGDEFWLIELGSSNGTTLNGFAVTAERALKDGDVILLGGSSEIVFELEKEEAKDTDSVSSSSAAPSAPATNSPAETAIAADTEKASKMPLMLGIMGVVCGLAVVCVVVVILISLNSNKECQASAVISNPDTGETLSEETDVQATITNGGCVGRAIFMLDGQEFASANSEPYKVSLNPGDFGDSEGELHSLRVVLEDKNGNKLVQQNEVLLAFETLATPTPTPEGTPEVKTAQKTTQAKQAFSATEMPDAIRQTVKQFSANAAYKYDSQFLQDVQKKMAEYAVEGYFARAQTYRDVINVAYVQDQNLDPPLGYLLAMSRSKFNPQKQGAEEGLWRMTTEFATANSLNGMCGTETLSDASQNCAAKASALYMKNIVLNVFEGDVIYSVAAFGMSPQEAAVWKSSLPADRQDFWKIIKSPKQREELVKFFAAGIVAENPQKFGLKNDRPLSELYRNLMGN
jgi:FHA domain